ncbi:MAG: hypothetical protein ACI35O_13205 [Bacillaceae bacterium]
MKKLVYLLIGICITILITGCGKNTSGSDAPRDIPVKWATADIQNDYKASYDLLDDNVAIKDFYNDKSEVTKDKTLKEYKLTEWKAKEDKYYYVIMYRYSNEVGVTERLEVSKVKGNWKITNVFSSDTKFKLYVENLSPKVIKELYE